MRVLSYLGSLDPRLPRPVWILNLGGLANAVGNGLAFPFLVIYLHNVRGFSLGQAGIGLTAYSVGAILGTLLGGELTHRIGPRATIVGTMTASALVVGSVPWLGRPGLFWYLVGAITVATLLAWARGRSPAGRRRHR